MKLWRRLTLLVPLGLVLAGCGEWNLTQDADLNVDIEPSQLEYTATIEQDAETGSVSLAFESASEAAVTVSALPGSLGVNLEGYSLEYFYADGTPVIPGDNMMMVNNSVLPTVPPGVVCIETSSQFCSINSPDATFATGEPVTFAVLNALPNRIIYELFCDLRPDVGAYARLTIFGQDSLRRDFSTVLPSIPITSSGDFQVPNLGSVCF